MKAIECIKNTWSRALVWCEWLADPDGPSYKKKAISILFCIFGTAMLFLGTVALTLITSDILLSTNFVEFRVFGIQIKVSAYLGGMLIFFGGLFWVLGKHPARVDLKTAEYYEEIDILISSVRLRLNSMSSEQADEATKLISMLEKFQNMPTEVTVLRLTPLRKLQTLFYSPSELRPQIVAELETLKYYSGRKDETYDLFKKEVEELVAAENSTENTEKLVEYLRLIRSEVDNVRYKTGYGEAIIESMTYWSVISGIALLIVGFSPLFDQPYFESPLNIAHWAVFGFQGALLSTITHMRKLEPFEIGEDDGNWQLRKMVMGLFIGAIAAIMLYLAIQSGMLGGKALPKLASNEQGINDPVARNALSVFWAIAAGFSGSTLIERLLRQAEQNEASA